MNEFYKSLLDPKGRFGFWGIFLLIVLGIALMVVPGMFLEPKEARYSTENPALTPQDISPNSSSLGSLEEALVKQATNILSQVKGVGEISVAISLESGQEQDYARNLNNQKAVVEENDPQGGVRVTTEFDEQTEYVLVQNRNEPLLLKEKAPRIKGILVVAEGAIHTEIKIQLSKALQSLFDLPAHRIMILPKEGR